MTIFTSTFSNCDILQSVIMSLFNFVICIYLLNTVKSVLSGHSKLDKTKVLKTKGSLIKVKSIAECSFGAFCNTFDLH